MRGSPEGREQKVRIRTALWLPNVIAMNMLRMLSPPACERYGPDAVPMPRFRLLRGIMPLPEKEAANSILKRDNGDPTATAVPAASQEAFDSSVSFGGEC